MTDVLAIFGQLNEDWLAVPFRVVLPITDSSRNTGYLEVEVILADGSKRVNYFSIFTG